MPIWLIGMPTTCGGANDESGHTALLWREAGFDVRVLCFSRCICGNPVTQPAWENDWLHRLDRAHIPVLSGNPGRLKDVSGLSGSAIVAFCNSHLLHNWKELAALGCRLIWSPCMTYATAAERAAFENNPPHAVHYQSEYQRTQLYHQYNDWKCKQHFLAHGAFVPTEWPTGGQSSRPFTVGRLARPDRRKWTPELWQILSKAREKVPDLRALCMAWDKDIEFACGPPPEYAQCLPADSLSSDVFLSMVDLLICPNWAATENWPRVGLEAMHAGVPILADDSGGWREMLYPGCLVSRPRDYTAEIVRLANSRSERVAIVASNRARLNRLADFQTIAAQWRDAFGTLPARGT